MLQSSFFYFSIFIITSLLAEFTTRLRTKYRIERIMKMFIVIIMLSIPSFFSGIRYGIGTDYFAYVKIFENVDNNFSGRIELGYQILNYIVKTLGGSVNTVFFIASFIMYMFVYLFLYQQRKLISVGLGMFVFSLLYYNFSFNAVRSAISIAISLYAYKYIADKKLNKYILFTLLSISFHNSAVLTLPFYFLYNYIGNKSQFSRLFLYILIVLGMVNYDSLLVFISNNIFKSTYYLSYISSSEAEFGFGLFIIYMPIILPGILFYRELTTRSSYFKFFYFLFITGFILKFVGYFGGAFLSRISEQFLISLIWIIPYYYSSFSNRKSKLLFAVTSVSWAIFYWYFYFILQGFNETIPYTTIF